MPTRATDGAFDLIFVLLMGGIGAVIVLAWVRAVVLAAREMTDRSPTGKLFGNIVGALGGLIIGSLDLVIKCLGALIAISKFRDMRKADREASISLSYFELFGSGICPSCAELGTLQNTEVDPRNAFLRCKNCSFSIWRHQYYRASPKQFASRGLAVLETAGGLRLVYTTSCDLCDTQAKTHLGPDGISRFCEGCYPLMEAYSAKFLGVDGS